MWIDRILSSVVVRAMEQFPAVVVTGPRQAGKTSLVRHLFQEADYVSFDVPVEAERARLAPDDFFAGCSKPLIIDEAQYVPELFRQLKIRIDQDRQPGRFLITGSQDFSLMRNITESLAGRIAVLSLPLLSLPEVCKEGGNAESDLFFFKGGFPQLWVGQVIDRDLWMGSYLATYLERDIRNILNVGNLRDFDRFIRSAALRSGQLLSVSDLARDVGISPNTAKAWISTLQASGQIFMLEPYHTNAGKRLIKTPKLYFADVGLLLYLLGFRDLASVRVNPLWGAIWETAVISEVRKLFMNAGRRPVMWFWRTAQGAEVDLVLEESPGRFIGVECKAAVESTARDVAGLRALQDMYGDGSLKKGYVVNRGETAYPLSVQPDITAISLGGVTGLLAQLQPVVK